HNTITSCEVLSNSYSCTSRPTDQNYLALDATIASGRYMSRLLPWNSAFSLTVNRERSTRSHRVNFHVACGEPDPVSRAACSNPTTKCTASSRTLFVDFFGSK